MKDTMSSVTFSLQSKGLILRQTCYSHLERNKSMQCAVASHNSYSVDQNKLCKT